MKTLDKEYLGWDTDSHVQAFDLWNKKSNFEFNFTYGNFAEQRYLLNHVKSNKGSSILDVGCASATSYRFLKNKLRNKDFDYTGVDLSNPALKRAKDIYPEINVIKKNNENLYKFFNKKFDVVYSRDTVMHQTDPYGFLKELIEISKDVLILRLRTRDLGKTEFNFNKSCQMHYDKYWMPYIVLNFDELISFFERFKKIRSITFNKEYHQLAGSYLRYLPKDMYFSKIGTAETSLMIEFSDKNNLSFQVFHDTKIQGHHFIKKKWLHSFCFKVLHKLLKK